MRGLPPIRVGFWGARAILGPLARPLRLLAEGAVGSVQSIQNTLHLRCLPTSPPGRRNASVVEMPSDLSQGFPRLSQRHYQSRDLLCSCCRVCLNDFVPLRRLVPKSPQLDPSCFCLGKRGLGSCRYELALLLCEGGVDVELEVVRIGHLGHSESDAPVFHQSGNDGNLSGQPVQFADQQSCA